MFFVYVYAIKTWYSFDFLTIHQLRRHWINSPFQKKIEWSARNPSITSDTPIKLSCIYICWLQGLLHSIHLYYVKTISICGEVKRSNMTRLYYFIHLRNAARNGRRFHAPYICAMHIVHASGRVHRLYTR